MKKEIQKLTLDRPTNYQIQVPGVLDKYWSEWYGDLKVTVNKDHDGISVTTLIGNIDQAALQGLLRRLYSMGLPVISVICLDYIRRDSGMGYSNKSTDVHPN